jgi:predicted transcriptional regulator
LAHVGRPRKRPLGEAKRFANHAYRNVVLAYYGYCCQHCGSTELLELHHIDGNPHNDKLENLTLLCLKCNRDAERDVNQKIALTLRLISEGKYPATIARSLEVSRQLIHYYVHVMLEKGFIKFEKRTRTTSYSLTPKGAHYLKHFEVRSA